MSKWLWFLLLLGIAGAAYGIWIMLQVLNAWH